MRSASLLKFLTEKVSARRRYRQIVRELSQFSERELNEMGFSSVDIHQVARASVAN
jgi:uncharacterized protein YjiS (DUF1127 family)